MDWNRFNAQLRSAVDTGKVVYGTKETLRECLMGEPKIIIVSKTIKNIIKKQIEHYSKLLNVIFIEYPENGFELGSVCGKPFNVSALVVTNLGQSSIIDVINLKEVKEEKVTKVKIKAEKRAVKEEKKAEKTKAKKLKEMKKEEEDQKSIKEDEALKGILKIKKK
jgi:large subunit ribosomal protein L30e